MSPSHEAGLLFIDGKLAERLAPGRHAFWQVGRTERIAKLDLRPQPPGVTALAGAGDATWACQQPRGEPMAATNALPRT